jgi:VIT1/CCC1 family predicted Fe2+/Mn2+ transporter
LHDDLVGLRQGEVETIVAEGGSAPSIHPLKYMHTYPSIRTAHAVNGYATHGAHKHLYTGVGYFIGAACITFNYYFALGVLLFFILLAMPWAITGESKA